jgi:hypothetical protein
MADYLDSQPTDFFFQHVQPLYNILQCPPDNGRRERSVFLGNLGVGYSQGVRFHESETTKSGLIFHQHFSPP